MNNIYKKDTVYYFVDLGGKQLSLACKLPTEILFNYGYADGKNMTRIWMCAGDKYPSNIYHRVEDIRDFAQLARNYAEKMDQMADEIEKIEGINNENLTSH